MDTWTTALPGSSRHLVVFSPPLEGEDDTAFLSANPEIVYTDYEHISLGCEMARRARRSVFINCDSAAQAEDAAREAASLSPVFRRVAIGSLIARILRKLG